MKIRGKAFAPEEKVVQRTSGLRSSRPNARDLFLLTLGLFRLLAGLPRGVLHAEADADLAQEVVGRSAAGEDPHEIVGDLVPLTLHVQNHALLFKLHRVRLEDYFDLSRTHAFFDAFGVALLDARE